MSRRTRSGDEYSVFLFLSASQMPSTFLEHFPQKIMLRKRNINILLYANERTRNEGKTQLFKFQCFLWNLEARTFTLSVRTPPSRLSFFSFWVRGLGPLFFALETFWGSVHSLSRKNTRLLRSLPTIPRICVQHREPRRPLGLTLSSTISCWLNRPWNNTADIPQGKQGRSRNIAMMGPYS